MKTSIAARAITTVAAAAMTFLLLQSLALYGLPAEAAPPIAQASVAIAPR